VFPK